FHRRSGRRHRMARRLQLPVGLGVRSRCGPCSVNVVARTPASASTLASAQAAEVCNAKLAAAAPAGCRRTHAGTRQSVKSLVLPEVSSRALFFRFLEVGLS